MSMKYILIPPSEWDFFCVSNSINELRNKLNYNEIFHLFLIGSQKENCYKELQHLGLKDKKLKLFKSLPGLIRCDSWEEVQFFAWCVEAKREGLIKDFEWKPEGFVIIKQNLGAYSFYIPENTYYNPDAILILPGNLNPPKTFDDIFLEYSWSGDTLIMIDIKPSFQIQNSRDEVFQLKKKLMIEKWGIQVNEVLIKSKKNWKKQEDRGIFERTWCPEFCRWTPTGKRSSVFDGCRTVERFKEFAK